MESPGNSVGRAVELLSGILERMGMDAEIEVREESDRTTLDIRCDDVQRIIGRRGQVIDALQHLVGKMLVRDRSGQRDKPIVVDAGGYRERHVERLRELAERMAEKALKTRRIVELNPMPAHDRRIVHMALAEREGISTRSEGEGDDRHILVVPE
jgi:spoIIIJ-associated protein